MFAEERPAPLPLPLPLEPFRDFQFGKRTVHLDGCVEVEVACYGAPPGRPLGRIGRREDALFRMRQRNPTVDRGARNRVGGYRFRAAQAAGVKSASRWMETSAKPGSTAAR
jgi:hypothetical protein